MAAAAGGISTRLLCKAESSGSPCRPVSSLGSKCQAVPFRIVYVRPSISAVRRVANTNEHSDDGFSSSGFGGPWRGNGNDRFVKGGRIVPRAMFSWVAEPPPLTESEFEDARMEVLERVGDLNSIADFTRFRDNGIQGAELQTAIITYKTRFPLSLFRPQKVDLVAAVHIADREYFSNLQRDLSKFDRVLYEMVADKDKLQTNRLGKMRWRPPRRLPGRRGGHGFSIIGAIQRTMATLLTLEFQLECMDYRRENWYHADLDYDTFAVLQRERGESFLSFAKDLTAMSSKAITKAAFEPSPGLDPWRQKLQWISRVMPMPLLGLLLIEGVCAPSHAPLKTSPEMKALLELDIPGALKVFLAKQITTDFADSTSPLVENSVIIGERNRVAMEELRAAFKEGCSKVAVFYGSGHLPDMDRRLREEFNLYPTGINWRTAWAIRGREHNTASELSVFLSSLAKKSGWALNRYQTLALLLISAVLAVDLWFWEVFLGACNDYLESTLSFIVGLLDKGWSL